MTSIADSEFIGLQQALAGEYSLERELGRGGMGIVYLAREVQLDRMVAIKVLRPELSSRLDVRARFLREARLAASLSHPNIIQIFRVAELSELTYIAMQYVDGETLGERLRRRGPVTPPDAVAMLREVAWALAHAHGRGIVHRDVKPDNIVLDRETGRALVGDFGIATARTDERLSDLESVMGSAHFMSPEQGNRDTVDGTSDLYSLGVVGYVALSGRFPFDGATLGELLAKQGRQEAPSLESVAPSVPRHLVLAITRCLRIAPGERFASAERFAEALDEAKIARAALPLELRVWVEARSPWTAISVAWSIFFGLNALRGAANLPPMHEVLRPPRFPFALRAVLQDVALAVAPAVVTILLRARVAHQLFASGYTVADARIGLQSADEERRRDVVHAASLERSWLRRAFRWVAWGAFGLGVAAFLIPWGGLSRVGYTIQYERMVLQWLKYDGLAAVALSYAVGVPMIPGFHPLARLRRMFWNSRLGAGVARLLTPAHPAVASQLAHRPTEIALGLAVEQLFLALPSAYRESVRDLPDVVRRLEAHAQRAREQLSMLNTELRPGDPTGSGSAEPSVAEHAVRCELRDAISALESLRLHLLRLHGGVADLQPITTVLDAARRVGDDLGRLDHAQHEVSGVPPRLGLELHTPTPS